MSRINRAVLLVLMLIAAPVALAAVAGTMARWSGQALTLQNLSVAVSATSTVLTVTPTQDFTTSNNGPEFFSTDQPSEPAADGIGISFVVSPNAGWVDPQNALFSVRNGTGVLTVVDIFGNWGGTAGNVNMNQHMLAYIPAIAAISPALTDAVLSETGIPSLGSIQLSQVEMSYATVGVGSSWTLSVTDGSNVCTASLPCDVSPQQISFTGSCVYTSGASLAISSTNSANCTGAPDVRNLIIRYNNTTL